MRGDEKKKKRQPLRARLRRWINGAAGYCCRIETQGMQAMVVQGCCGIEEYCDSRIVLQVKDPLLEKICICGENLLCTSYHSDGVVVEGKILCVTYCDIDTVG